MTAPATSLATAAGAARALRSTAAVRERAGQLLRRVRAGQSAHFALHEAALPLTARTVAELTRARFPELRIPYHSRWRHFEAGQVDRLGQLDRALERQLGAVAPAERARAQIDLALVSVLLDAGAGPDWRYQEAPGGSDFSRSEGLAVASFHAFMAGLFSGDPQRPLQVDADGLAAITAERLAQAFQVGPHNPLVGLEGRAGLLRRLGHALRERPDVFGPAARPGGLFDALLPAFTTTATTATASATTAAATTATTAAVAATTATASAAAGTCTDSAPPVRPGDAGQVPPVLHAHDLLVSLLDTLSGIWPAQNRIGDVPLGDCWRHPAVQGEGLTAGWVPFHKLSQWLTYSLLEPFQWAGVAVQGLDALTGLPEYRNGGLFIDAGVLRPLPPDHAGRVWQAGDPFIVEWRALTVALLDELAPLVRAELGLPPDRLPLACVLEGGTWAAGRALAQRLRGGLPPLQIASDGTVF